MVDRGPSLRAVRVQSMTHSLVCDRHGPSRPDHGQGGKYLIFPPGFDGEVPEGYFTPCQPRSKLAYPARGFLRTASPEFSSKLFREGLKIYPLARAANPPEMEFSDGSGKAFNTIHSNDFNFFEELHAVIDREPIEMIEPQLRGSSLQSVSKG